MTEFVDHKARAMADKAIAMIEAHERFCTERATAAGLWRESAGQKLEDIERAMRGAVSGIYNRLWIAATGLITVLLAVIGYLIAHKGL